MEYAGFCNRLIVYACFLWTNRTGFVVCYPITNVKPVQISTKIYSYCCWLSYKVINRKTVYRMKWKDDRRVLNLKGFGRKRSWPSWDTIASFRWNLLSPSSESEIKSSKEQQEGSDKSSFDLLFSVASLTCFSIQNINAVLSCFPFLLLDYTAEHPRRLYTS
jgi:hypothetical protein